LADPCNAALISCSERHLLISARCSGLGR
jgi:hypothetical protein